jgi:cell division protease FtsH
MVTDYGMTESLGAVKYGSGDQEPFLGMNYGAGSTREYSEAIAADIDAEVAGLINNAHQEAFDVLTTNRAVLDELVRQLFEKETLDKEQVAKIFEPLQRWPKRPAWTGSASRVPSEVPPVEPPERLTQKLDEPAAAAIAPPVPQYPAPGYPGPFPPISGQPPYPQGGYPPYGQSGMPGQPPVAQPPQSGPDASQPDQRWP